MTQPISGGSCCTIMWKPIVMTCMRYDLYAVHSFRPHSPAKALAFIDFRGSVRPRGSDSSVADSQETIYARGESRLQPYSVVIGRLYSQ
jgi:hypothetical protein